MIFVFGSNEAGIHGAGAARAAHLHYGAVMGKGYGLMGESFAIPTKDHNIDSLSVEEVKHYVEMFLRYASKNRKLTFKVTQIGCGLAGFTPKQIAPMFENASDNCLFDTDWEKYLPGKQFWGHV
jgi:hypothetical protein